MHCVCYVDDDKLETTAATNTDDNLESGELSSNNVDDTLQPTNDELETIAEDDQDLTKTEQHQSVEQTNGCYHFFTFTK